MDMPKNELKKKLSDGALTMGCWLGLGNHIAAEILAGSGFDWLLMDMEHNVVEMPDIYHQLHAMQGYPVSPVVRVPWNDTVMIKRVLDLGVQSVLIPYVQTVEEAKQAVSAVRYPPNGVRGYGPTRAARWGRIRDYHEHADSEICLMLQVESQTAVSKIEEIAALDGVDVLFIGPADLAADMGFLGRPNHPEVKAAIKDAIIRINNTGKVAGMLAFDEEDAQFYMKHGANFVAVTADGVLLARGASKLLGNLRGK